MLITTERTFTPFLRHLECCKTVEPSPSLYLTRVKSIGKECHEITICRDHFESNADHQDGCQNRPFNQGSWYVISVNVNPV